MRPNIVMPMNDPKGLLFPLLEIITPQLKELFEYAFVSIPLATHNAQARYVEWLKGDPFFRPFVHTQDVTSVGDDFLTLYGYAAASSAPAQTLHLCFIDRVAYALQSEHQGPFSMDMQMLQAGNMPLIFQRSEAAWQTHPHNYQELEEMVTRVGELLFGKSLDFAWCHLALRAEQLQAIVPQIQARDLSLMAEMVLLLRDVIKTKDVDWLAWEDFNDGGQHRNANDCQDDKGEVVLNKGEIAKEVTSHRKDHHPDHTTDDVVGDEA
jgi:hypothetical protein